MLVARSPSGGDSPAGVGTGEKIALDGEPVIPNFPLVVPGRFLGITSGGYAYEATPADVNDDPEQWLATLAKTYPGLPQAYLSAILVYTLTAAYSLPIGRPYRVFVTPTEATLQDVKSGDLLPIWKEMKTETYLG